jgi:hypothetical protein
VWPVEFGRECMEEAAKPSATSVAISVLGGLLE